MSIVCPTGTLVYAFKSRLPDVEGIENIQVDTIHGLLKYKRPGPDQKVVWAPPTALRKVDMFLLDEGSQYDDQEVRRFFQCMEELAHKPLCGVAEDFQQL